MDDNAYYREIFGRNPEPWRAPLGALRLTLTPGDPKPWLEEDGSRFVTSEAYYTGNPRRYNPRPEYDPPWTLERARDELEELVKVLNGVEE